MFTAREKIDTTYTDEKGRVRKYVLPELVIYTVFCRSCVESGGSAKFGKGRSARSREAAEKRWNSLCLDEKLKMFKNAVKTGN